MQGLVQFLNPGFSSGCVQGLLLKLKGFLWRASLSSSAPTLHPAQHSQHSLLHNIHNIPFCSCAEILTFRCECQILTVILTVTVNNFCTTQPECCECCARHSLVHNIPVVCQGFNLDCEHGLVLKDLPPLQRLDVARARCRLV